MRITIALLVLGCSATAAPVSWQEVAPAREVTLGSYAYFADADGVWRCHKAACVRFGWEGRSSATVPLPCDSQLVPSPSGTLVAQRCGGEVVVTSLPSGKLAFPRRPLEEVDELVVDDSGTVSATRSSRARYAPEDDDKVIGWDPAVAIRIKPNGARKRYELDPPDDAIERGSKAGVHPARGAWLAYSDGAYHLEAAWRASDPPKQVALGGGALFNGDKMWISTMKNGYQRMTDAGPVALKNRFGGGLPGHGLLLDIAPWGRDGLIAQYETAFVLLDGELATKRVIKIPQLPKEQFLYSVVSDPTGKRVCLATLDGRIRCTSL